MQRERERERERERDREREDGKRRKSRELKEREIEREGKRERERIMFVTNEIHYCNVTSVSFKKGTLVSKLCKISFRSRSMVMEAFNLVVHFFIFNLLSLSSSFPSQSSSLHLPCIYQPFLMDGTTQQSLESMIIPNLLVFNRFDI